MAATDTDRQTLENVKDEYKYGWSQPENYAFKSRKGLDHDIVEQISVMKGEPEWMRQLRHEALDIFLSKPIPTWGADLSAIDYQDIYYYIKPVESQSKSWDDVPADIKETFDKLGIPEAERKFLAGAGAQYESEAVYHSLKQEWEKQGVLFVDSDTGLREHPEIYKEYFGTVVPSTDNVFAALNTACWSGGSFVYVPKGVHLDIPLQAYFRINAQSMGQFERTLIIVDEGASIHYVEGCTAPSYSQDSLHSGVIEIIVRKGARCRYSTIQNWSTNVYNLVTQRSLVYEGATMEWVDANLGSKVTMKYPSVYMLGEGAHGADPVDGVCRQGPAPGHRRQAGACCAEHVEPAHLQVDQQERRPGQLPRPAQGRQGRARGQVQRGLRRAAAGRKEPIGHLPLHRDRRGRRHRRP